ncbi:MAG: hypothetical protein QNK05_02895 [Myxococcota bacterium]|nr:hypothetical protein [Myxococcota bacterium]
MSDLQRKRLASAYLEYRRSGLTAAALLRTTPLRAYTGPLGFLGASVLGFVSGAPWVGWLSLGCLCGVVVGAIGNARRVAAAWPHIDSFLDWAEVERRASE